MKYIQVKTLIVGSGAAGLAAADYLYNMGHTDVLVLTEGLKLGASRNTGSDKQTYYKLSQAGDKDDSVVRMAHTLFEGGCVDGDVALAEAAGSARAFYHLIDLGVDFPCNLYGEYVGYQTDHDVCKRGISIGPLTSKRMVECLERSVKNKGVALLEHHMALEILTQEDNGKTRATGVLALDQRATAQGEDCFVAIQAQSIIWATGGEAAMYQDSVYPTAQKGGMSPALEAGVVAKNLTESQYGLASTKFRWNVSGTYQQCLPRYVSVDEEGVEHEFLNDGFATVEQLVNAVFLKGYQWPFDPRKIANYGSSMVDVLVYKEKYQRNRRVYMDFTKNSSLLEQDGQLLTDYITGEAREYLDNCGALQRTPIERLEAMNPDAIALYADHNIDITKEYLEISICAQHNNGGLQGDLWWQSNIAGFFPIGEVNGTHGIYRPGGSALNAGQVGALRVAQYISRQEGVFQDQTAWCQQQQPAIERVMAVGQTALHATEGMPFKPEAELLALGARQSQYGSIFRSQSGVLTALAENKAQRQALQQVQVASPVEWIQLYRIRGLLLSQQVYLQSILDYIEQVGQSRGSYLVIQENGDQVLDMLEGSPRYQVMQDPTAAEIQEISYCKDQDMCHIQWRTPRPIPESDQWFERVWQAYRNGLIH